ncbi:MAG: hypothetical protein IT198_00915 [Acidimicrobiia bacterium]|nr:hypothetical protein [Acidimicrobiia bacterium]
MHEHEDPLDIRRFGAVVWTHRWLITLVTVGVALVGLGFSLLQTPTYSARATVVDGRTSQASSAAQARDLILTDIRVMESREVATAAAEKLDFAGGPAYVVRHVSARSENGAATSVITVTATDSDPVRAAATANAVVDAFVAFQAAEADQRANEKIAGLEAQLAVAVAERDQKGADLAQGGDVQIEYDAAVARVAALEASIAKLKTSIGRASADFRVIQHAAPPTRPSSPRTGLNVAVAVAFGLLLGVSTAFVRDHLDDRIRSVEDVEEALGLPSLGSIPASVAGKRRRRRRGVDPEIVGAQTAGAEAFRRARVNLRALGLGKTVRTVGVAAAQTGGNAASVTANLATTLSRGALRVTVLDCDLHQPELHRIFRSTNDRGVSTSLSHGGTLGTCVVAVKIASSVVQISLVPAGPRPAVPSDVLATSRFGQLLAEALEESSVALVAMPPVLAVSDACTLAPHLDGVLLVASCGVTTRDELRNARRSIEQAGGRVLGSIITDVPGCQPRRDSAYAPAETPQPSGVEAQGNNQRRAAKKGGPRHAAVTEPTPATPPKAAAEPARPGPGTADAGGADVQTQPAGEGAV